MHTINIQSLHGHEPDKYAMDAIYKLVYPQDQLSINLGRQSRPLRYMTTFDTNLISLQYTLRRWLFTFVLCLSTVVYRMSSTNHPNANIPFYDSVDLQTTDVILATYSDYYSLNSQNTTAIRPKCYEFGKKQSVDASNKRAKGNDINYFSFTLMMSALVYSRQSFRIQSVISMLMIYITVIAQNVTSLTWTDSSIAFPVARSGMISGYDTESNVAWFLGGWTYDTTQSNYYSWNLTSELFTEHGTLPIGAIQAESELFTTIQNAIYFLGYGNNALLLFDMETMQMIQTNITTPQGAGFGCLTSYLDKYLVVLGGSNDYSTSSPTNQLQLYDFETNSWITNPSPPSMSQPRTLFACEVVGNYVYAAGGRINSVESTTDSIEKLNVLLLNTWEPLTTGLQRPTAYHRSIKLGYNIVVIGGYYHSSVLFLPFVNIIYTLDDSVRYDTDLNHGISRTNIIQGPNNNIIVVGGRVDQVAIDTIQVSSSFPTSEPTFDPTSDPTIYPTLDPTIDPTIYPTFDPTVDPTVGPTSLPTTDPTVDPTVDPTNDPSLAPSDSPTACTDYYDYKSFDGIDVTYDTEININISDIISAYENVQQYATKLTPDFVTLYKTDIFCNDTNADLCLILCPYNSLCAQTRIESLSYNDETLNLNEIKVVCTDKRSCDGLQLMMNRTQHIKVDKVSFVCTEVSSCADVDISISVNTNITIQCNEAFACNNMLINLYGDDNETYANIHCYKDNSCDGLMINTDHSNNIFIHLKAYRYSKDILINQYNYSNVNIQCAVDQDHRYIRYDTEELLDPSELLRTARYEYSSHMLPCDDIRILCATDRECEFRYELYNFSLIDLFELNDKEKPKCYWLDSVQLYKASCIGSCDDDIDYYIYNKTLPMELTLGSSYFNDKDNANATNKTISCLVCDAYFGTINDTESTLSSIDAIFNDVLRLIQSFESKILHYVLVPPQTILNVNSSFIECVNEDYNTIEIQTHVTIESIESNEKRFDSKFENDFIPLVQEFLSKFFGLPVNVEISELISKEVFNGVKPWILVVVTLIALVIIIGIIFIVVRKRKQQKARMEALTTYMKNPMVLSIGIAFYEKEPETPAVDGYFRDLLGVQQDTQHVMDMFYGKLNYNVFPKENKHKWTSKELVDFMEERANDLEANIDDYDGLLVFLSCHGIQDKVVASDYQTIQKTAVHRIFTMERPIIRKIPRVFIYDCCDGEEERDRGFRCDTIYQTDGNVDDGEKGFVEEMQTDVKKTVHMDAEVEMTSNLREKGKNIDLNALRKTSAPMWLQNEDNPDFQLVTIHASNQGFQSKMDIYAGSYLITNFIQKLEENIFEANNKRFLYELFDDIQQYLHSEGKQQLMSTYYNKMRYIKFEKNDEDELGHLGGSDTDRLSTALSAETKRIRTDNKS